MRTTVHPAAKVILDFIARAETGEGKSASRPYGYGYNCILKHAQDRFLRKPLVEHTLLELQREQLRMVKVIGGSASGRYQFIYKTLGRLIEEEKPSIHAKFDRVMQDQLGQELLRERGLDRWAAGQMSEDSFMVNLAKEWASFPVPYAMQGASRKLQAGQSYYSGDGLNRAQESIRDVRDMLARARAKLLETPDKWLDTPAPPLNTNPKDPEVVASLWQALLRAYEEWRAATGRV